MKANFVIFLVSRFDRGWNQINNFATHVGGRTLVFWNHSNVYLEPLSISPQVIHFKATCLITSISSFMYGMHSIVGRRPLYDNLLDFSLQTHSPWPYFRF